MNWEIIIGGGILLAIIGIIIWIWKSTRDPELEEKNMVEEIEKNKEEFN